MDKPYEIKINCNPTTCTGTSLWGWNHGSSSWIYAGSSTCNSGVSHCGPVPPPITGTETDLMAGTGTCGCTGPELNCGASNCGPTETCCDGTTCVATDSFQTDNNRCGDCNTVCEAGYICVDGECVIDCAANSCTWTWNGLIYGCCTVFVTVDGAAVLYNTSHEAEETCAGQTNTGSFTFNSSTWSPTLCPDLGPGPIVMNDPSMVPPIDFNFEITENIAALWRAGDDPGFRAANTALAPAGYIFNSGDFGSIGSGAFFSTIPISIAYYANWFATDPANPIQNLNSSATYAGMPPGTSMWVPTTPCPQDCACSVEEPAEDGTTNGQVISYPCNGDCACEEGDGPPDPDPNCDSALASVTKQPEMMPNLGPSIADGPCSQEECEAHVSTWMAEASGKPNEEGLYKVKWILLDDCPGACCSDQPTQPEFVKTSTLVDAPCKCGCS